MKIFKIVSMVALTLALALFSAGFILHTVFEKVALVYPGQAFWFHFCGALLVLISAAIELYTKIREGELKEGLIKTLPAIVTLPLILIVLIDPYYVYINLATIAVFVYLTYRMVFCLLFSKCLIKAIILTLLTVIVVILTIVCFSAHDSFEQMNWDIPAAITAFLCIIASFFTFSKTGKLLEFLPGKNPRG